MKIIAIIITCNRANLLARALASVKKQKRQADSVYIFSNSTANNFLLEQNLCASFGFQLFKNRRSENYAGALNTAVEEIIKTNGIADNLFFASLDDDDEWLPDYLCEIERNNTNDYDLLISNLLRSSKTENNLLKLPRKLSEKDFLVGNPGVSGSNTFIKLKTLLQAGAFDESLPATIDRDFFVRVFLLNPSYKIVNKHLVTQHTDNDRERVTTNQPKKEKSLHIFFYKYQHLMSKTEKEQFFKRIKKLFSVNKNVFKYPKQKLSAFSNGKLVFEHKSDYQFVIGFISSDKNYVDRILYQIIEQNIPADLILIINNTRSNSLDSCEQILKRKIPYRIIHPNEWKNNLKQKKYGRAFSAYTEINSIPLGRTILHYHLYNETINFHQAVFWIIDDDITFDFIRPSEDAPEKVNVLEIINQNLNKVDAIIGSVNNDPPLPFLSSIRCQLVDFLHSHWAKNKLSQDLLNLRKKADYYYDLSDLLSDHLESPIYHTTAHEDALNAIFSGKSISRKVLQKAELKGIEQIVTQRGPNTLVFNRELLHYYPVINLSVKHKFARRGDLLWVLFNQIISDKKIIEHTYSVKQNRTITPFNLHRELEKSAYDIIGYAFNKSFLKTIQKIKAANKDHNPKDIFEKLNTSAYFYFFQSNYKHFLQKRKVKFLMNYYRIIGLLSILAPDFKNAKRNHDLIISQTKAINIFYDLLSEAENEDNLKCFIKELTTVIWEYSNAITTVFECKNKHQSLIKAFFDLKNDLIFLGRGSEGIVFTDNTWVYKSYFNIQAQHWAFLKEKSIAFSDCNMLEKIEYFEDENHKIIRYPFHPFQALQVVPRENMIRFLKFCKTNQFIFSNIAPKNFIQTLSGQIKLIDYGKSFEPFTEERFINTSKRAFLLYRFPKMQDEDFKKLTAKININEIPSELQDWQQFYKEIILDD